MKFGVSSAYIVGECEKCKEPATGHFRTDDCEFSLRCVSCGVMYNYKVPDCITHGSAWEINVKQIKKL